MSIVAWILDFLVPLGALLRVERKFPDGMRDVVLRALPQTFFGFWLCSFIPVVGGLVYMLVLVPVSIWRHVKLAGSTGNNDLARIALVHFTVILIGFGSVWSFIGHFFLADYVAGQIGWPTGSPFQTELAFFTLGTGVAGLLAVWVRDHLITGLVIAKSIFWLGAAGVHIFDALAHGNYAPSNIGAPLIGDLIFPAVLLSVRPGTL